MNCLEVLAGVMSFPHGAMLLAPLLVTRVLMEEHRLCGLCSGWRRGLWERHIGRCSESALCITRSGSTQKRAAQGGLAEVGGETLEARVELTRYLGKWVCGEGGAEGRVS